MLDAVNARDIWQRMCRDLVTVTFGSRAAANVADAPAWSSYTLRADRKFLTQSLSGMGGVVLPERGRVWQMWAALMEDATAVAPASLPVPDPKENDRITDPDGVKWIVRRVEVKLFGNCFTLTCEREVA